VERFGFEVLTPVSAVLDPVGRAAMRGSMVANAARTAEVFMVNDAEGVFVLGN
jgi:hypothetical protein